MKKEVKDFLKIIDDSKYLKEVKEYLTDNKIHLNNLKTYILLELKKSLNGNIENQEIMTEKLNTAVWLLDSFLEKQEKNEKLNKNDKITLKTSQKNNQDNNLTM